VKDSLEDAGRKPAQETQKKEAHKDLKDQGEVKKSSVAKRRQVRKVATMVKRLKKNPEDGELQTPTEGEVVLTAGDGWDAQQQATVTPYAQSRGMQIKSNQNQNHLFPSTDTIHTSYLFNDKNT